MQIINPQIVSGKKVLLRYDIDVALRLVFDLFEPERPQSRRPEAQTRRAPFAQGKPSVAEDFKLKAGLATLKLCLDYAKQVILMGHVGRPDGKVMLELSVEPIRRWFETQVHSDKLKILENLRFDPREEACDQSYAEELAQMGDIYVNEAFSAYRPAISTTVLPTLLSHGAGLHFAKEVQVLREVRDNPKKPFVVIMGGTKVADKLPVIQILAKKADAVLVGGKLIHEIREQNIALPANVLVGKLSEDGFDIAAETTDAWQRLIEKAAMIIWNGPVGKFEDSKNEQSAKIAEIVLQSGAQIIVGGGDTISLLGSLGLLDEYEKRGFVSVGGGAMLKLLSEGTLPTIEALND